MHPALAQRRVSCDLAEFRQLVEHHLELGEPIVAHLRYAYCGGYGEKFLARSLEDFNSIMETARGRRRTAITLYFADAFALRGRANHELCEQAIQFLSDHLFEQRCIDLVRLDAPAIALDRDTSLHFATPDEIREWFANHQGVAVLVGAMEFWHENNDNTLTVYVPDDDGIVRPGAY